MDALKATARAVPAVAGPARVSPQLDMFAALDGTGLPLQLPIDRIEPDPGAPRSEWTEAAVEALAADIGARGMLQSIVVAPVVDSERYRIRFGALRWHAAARAGMQTVPVTLMDRACTAYDQVAENLKRCDLSPIELARFFRSRVEAGDSIATIAKQLVIDGTTVAHHLSLLELQPPLAQAMASGRCTSPRTLHELHKLQGEEPEAVAGLLASGAAITRDAVAGLKADAGVAAVAGSEPTGLETVSADGAARFPSGMRTVVALMTRSSQLCERLDQTLARLSKAGLGRLPAAELAALRQRIAALAQRLEV